MAYDNNESGYETGAPKKADVLIRSTQHIALKQEELSEQTKLAVSRIDEAIDLFSKNNQDASYVIKQSGEIFSQLQGENSALKQELLYLAKQSENIYAGLAEKITELSEQSKSRDNALTGFADKINDISQLTQKSENAYVAILDKITELTEQNRRNENSYNALAVKLESLADRLEAVSARTAAKTANESGVEELSDRIIVTERIEPIAVDNTEILEKIDRLSEQLKRGGRVESVAADNTEVLEKIENLSEQLKNSGRAQTVNVDNSEILEKIDNISEQLKNGGKAQTVAVDNSEVLDKVNYISEQMKKNEGAHTMLSDKFEILSMRVEQFGFESAKGTRSPYAQPAVAPVAYPAPVQTLVKEEIDYDKLAEKVANLITSREVISPDYIASKVAEQIIIPEADAPDVKVSLDTGDIARQVADLINANSAETPAQQPVATAVEIDEDAIADKIAQRLEAIKAENETVEQPVATAVEIDEEAIADKIAQRLETLKSETAVTEQPVSATYEFDEEAIADKIVQKLGALKDEIAPASATANVADIDEEELAERLCRKLGGMRPDIIAPVAVSTGIDEEELADRIALKVGCIKSEDFEILVDDEGCSSISQEIANKLDYNVISNIVADKLREALDLAAVNAPDYEEMAERISEKITVAGINEDAIADKAAAILSNYLPEFDTDEITDKITGAVIDVVSAIPQPTIDSESICNTISERLIESQEDHDYDIVIDDEGISRITDLVTEEIQNNTVGRFDKMEEELAKITELLTAEDDEQEQTDEEVIDEETSDDKPEEVAEEVVEDYSKLSEVVAAEIEKGVTSRFDKVEEDIAKLTEIVTNAVSEIEYADEDYAEGEEYEENYSKLSEVIAAEIEKGVTSRLDSVEEKITQISEYITAEEEQYEDEEYTEEDTAEGEEYEEDYSKLSEVIAAEIEKGVSSRLDSVEENIAKITEYITAEGEEYDDEEYDEEAEEAAIAEEEQQYYAKLSEVVAAEIEKGVTSRFESVEENIESIKQLVANGAETQTVVAETQTTAEDYTKLSEVVAAEIEKGVSSRLDSVEENIAKITEYITAEGEEYDDEEYDEEAEEAAIAEEEQQYYAKLSEVVAAEIEKGVTSRFESVEEKITQISEYITAEEEQYDDEEYDEEAEEAAIAEEEQQYYAKLSEVVAAEIEKGVTSRFESVEEKITQISEYITAEEEQYDDEEYDEEAEEAAIAEEEQQYYAKLSEVVAAEIEKGVTSRFESVEENIESIKQLVANGAETQTVVAETRTTAEDYTKLSEVVAAEIEKGVTSRLDNVEENIAKMSQLVSNASDKENDARLDKVYDDIAKITGLVTVATQTNSRFDKIEEDIAKLSRMVEGGAENKDGERFEKYEEDLAQIKDMLASGIIAANVASDEAAAAQAAQSAEVVIEVPAEQAEEEEEALVTVSDLVQTEDDVDEEVEEEPAKQPEDAGDEQAEEDEEDENEADDGDDDFLIDVLDMDNFSDDELMPGEASDFAGGVDFANMMKFKRSFIARIIQSSDEYKQYYGEVKHALLSYKKVNSNVAWGAERFNKGRETIARMKIRGKTLCLYLALDPNNYKTSVYHHLDVSDNKSVAGTPMMVKIKSNLGVRKAIRLIDEMLAMRNGEKKEIPERDYAAMYPYETIEELIEDGLVKDVRKK